MDQVLRNLVSNAIKFSPHEGKIEIQAFFQKEVSEPSNPSDSRSREHSHYGLLPHLLNISPAGNNSSHHSSANDPENPVISVNQTPISGQGNIRGNLIIIVTDSGPGISEENQKKLFRSVVQFDPEKNQGGGGSGFGLFISKGIVDLHDGSISVYSAGEGHGCSFILAMPMTRSVALDRIDDEETDIVVRPAQPPMTSPSQKHKTSIRMLAKSNSVNQGGEAKSSSKSRSVFFTSVRNLVGGGGKRIGSIENMNQLDGGGSSPQLDGDHSPPRLNKNRSPPPNEPPSTLVRRRKYQLLIVDDSAMNRKMLCKTLRAAGHTCDEAADGLLAVNKVKQKLTSPKNGSGSTGMYDAILMDSNMPVMDGPSSATAIRALGVTIPIFGVTGNGGEEDVRHFTSHGATEVMVKPLDVTYFLARMKLLLPTSDDNDDLMF